MINMFTDIDGNTSSRIVSLFIVIIFDLVMVAYATITQKDIPTNATTVIMAITMSCVPIALTSQVYQNTKYRQVESRERRTTALEEKHRDLEKQEKEAEGKGAKTPVDHSGLYSLNIINDNRRKYETETKDNEDRTH